MPLETTKATSFEQQPFPHARRVYTWLYPLHRRFRRLASLTPAPRTTASRGPSSCSDTRLALLWRISGLLRTDRAHGCSLRHPPPPQTARAACTAGARPRSSRASPAPCELLARAPPPPRTCARLAARLRPSASSAVPSDDDGPLWPRPARERRTCHVRSHRVSAVQSWHRGRACAPRLCSSCEPGLCYLGRCRRHESPAMGCHTVTPVAHRHRRHRMVRPSRLADSALPIHGSDAELATVPRSAAGTARILPAMAWQRRDSGRDQPAHSLRMRHQHGCRKPAHRSARARCTTLASAARWQPAQTRNVAKLGGRTASFWLDAAAADGCGSAHALPCSCAPT